MGFWQEIKSRRGWRFKAPNRKELVIGEATSAWGWLAVSGCFWSDERSRLSVVSKRRRSARRKTRRTMLK